MIRGARVGLAAAILLAVGHGAGEAKVEVQCVGLVCKVWPTHQVPEVSSSHITTTTWRLVEHDRSLYFDFDCLNFNANLLLGLALGTLSNAMDSQPGCPVAGNPSRRL